MGPPGSGKGTQAEKLAKEFNLKVISTGDILREAIRNQTPLGEKVKIYVDKGELVPTEFVLELIHQKIKKNASFILDGFPRTVEQAKELEQITAIDRVVYFKCAPEIIVSRLSNRRICPKCAKVYNLITNPPRYNEVCDTCKTKLETRKDDSESVIRERIKISELHTLPLLEFYNSRLLIVDGAKDIESLYCELKSRLFEE